MKKLRFIGMNEKNGSLTHENIVITDDLKSPASEWLASGMEVYEDKIFDGSNLPDMFPTNTIFVKL